MTIEMKSTAFNPGGMIPAKHTCEGEDSSPALAWKGLPPGAKSVALIADDPDAPAGTWVHWVLYDLPAGTPGLPEGVKKSEAGPAGSKQGTNDFGKPGYGGPCPPSGVHRYYFKLYALDAPTTGLPAGATKQELLKAMQGHILAQGELVGRYKRSR